VTRETAILSRRGTSHTLARGAPEEHAVLDQTLRSKFEQALTFARHQTDAIIARYPDYHPMYTVGGKWKREGELWTHWCEGFFPGILWLLHKHSGEARWRTQAERYSARLEPRQFDGTVHDLGFLFFSTYLRWYRLTGESQLRDVLIQAGRTLATRFQPRGKYLASFIGPQSLFIDIMMNVGIIFWAAREVNDSGLRQIAFDHCFTTAKRLVREDGGAAHEGIFDTETGEFLRQSTHQGWSAGSTWSRGLAWALYGFTAAYRLSGERSFLDTAEKCAGCWLRHVPDGTVAKWDFDVPATGPQLPDSSASAIAASGLFDLAGGVTDAAAAQRYRSHAVASLRALCEPEFLADQTPGWEGILKRGIYHIHKKLGVDESVAWGEHFFVEGLVKALAGRSEAAW
jgi:unsaturated chondroitin disaccharide hydrolase